MPTGYTEPVRSGKVTDFPTFAMQCARNFGALIMMRDDPMDAPVPEEFKPDNYNKKRLEEARAELARLQALTLEQAELEATEEWSKQMREWDKSKEKLDADRARYEAMLAQVKAWVPPTVEHEGMKTFMAEQLKESIRFDCDYGWNKPERLAGQQWQHERIESALRTIGRSADEHEKEVARTDHRNRWIKALRESLKAYTPPQEGAPIE